MNASTSLRQTRIFFGSVTALFALNAVVCAQAANEPARVDAPDGVPELVAEKVISNQPTATTGKSAASVIVEEERIQGRLANARVSVGGTRSYTVVDPGVGRADRQPDNGGKRVAPSLWELFRF